MNAIRLTCLRFCGPKTPCRINGVAPGYSPLRCLSSWGFSWVDTEQRMLPVSSKATGMLYSPPWHYQQVRTAKRGTEYQPNNIKRKRTHGWIKRLSTRGGIEVILRRMLKGRKSLSH